MMDELLGRRGEKDKNLAIVTTIATLSSMREATIFLKMAFPKGRGDAEVVNGIAESIKETKE
jgi:hypothetical protein